MADVIKKIPALIGPDFIVGEIDVIISNDKIGKTLTISDGIKSFTFAFEHIEEDLK